MQAQHTCLYPMNTRNLEKLYPRDMATYAMRYPVTKKNWLWIMRVSKAFPRIYRRKRNGQVQYMIFTVMSKTNQVFGSIQQYVKYHLRACSLYK